MSATVPLIHEAWHGQSDHTAVRCRTAATCGVHVRGGGEYVQQCGSSLVQGGGAGGQVGVCCSGRIAARPQPRVPPHSQAEAATLTPLLDAKAPRHILAL